MTQDPSQTPEDPTPSDDRPAPDVTSARLADRWDADGWRRLLTGTALGLLTLPAAVMVVVGLLVLAVQGTATWLLVSGAALVTAVIGGTGAAVAFRDGHRGIVHRLGVLGGAWGVASIVGGVVIALALDRPDRVGVAVLLVLGGTYTLVLALALWAASTFMPAPAADASSDEDDATQTVLVTESAARTGAIRTVDEVPTPAAAPDDDALAEWPAWGGDAPGAEPGDVAPGGAAAASGRSSSSARRVAEPVVIHLPDDTTESGTTQSDATESDTTAADATEPRGGAPDTTSADTAVLDTDALDTALLDATEPDVSEEPAPRAPRSTAPAVRRSTTSKGTRGAAPAAPRSAPPAPTRTVSSSGSRPARRSVSSSGSARAGRAASSGPATERIARQDGDDGPPTQRMPPVAP